MSAEVVMIGLPLVVLLLGLGVLLMAYIGSMRTPVEKKRELQETEVDEIVSYAARVVLYEEAKRPIGEPSSADRDSETRLLEEIGRAR